MAGTTWSTPALWTASCIILAFYVLTFFPIAYIFFKHRKRGLTAWIYLTLFVLLQLGGWGIIAAVGRTQGPTYIAPALASVALSPLFVGTAGVLHEWFTTTRVANIDTNAPTAQSLLHAFHLIAVFSFGLILGGNVLEGMDGAPPYTRTLLQAGAFLLSVLFLALCVAAVGLWWHHSKDSCLPLIWSVLLALPFLGLRYVYELVTAFDDNADINQNYGKLVYRVVLQVIPQAIVLLLLIAGGVLARNLNAETRLEQHDTVPLVADEEERGSGDHDKGVNQVAARMQKRAT
ncbi:hypothetical protein Slin14017_G062220 [Septoria linicola]|nr:hypothetical protein Slin14017_G062220 [Septoria linicola]